MEKMQAFKFRLSLNGQQEKMFSRWIGQTRFVYNKALAQHLRDYEADKEKKCSAYDLINLLPKWKKQPETEWLSQCPSNSLSQAIMDLGAAFSRFFKKESGFPKFHRKGQKESMRFSAPPQVDNILGRIKLPKIGWVKFRQFRAVLGKVRQATVSKKAGKWFVSILTKQILPDPAPVSDKTIGIDLGCVHTVSTSEGEFADLPASVAKAEKRLRNAQKAQSRKVRRSKNFQKAVRRVQILHERIRNIRNDFQHKLTRRIADTYRIVCAEDLQVKNMSRSAKGTAEQHGRNVKAKSGLNRSILRQGWGELVSKLRYKLGWNGGELVPVNPKNTSRTCAQCGHISKANRETQAVFRCVSCGHTDNADTNAAINILRAGLARIASQVSETVSSAARRISARQQEETAGGVSADKLLSAPRIPALQSGE